MDPAIVGSSQFGQLFKTALPGNYAGVKEQVFSQPLVYTPSDGVQYVYLATTQNNIYKINAKTGAIVLSRNLAIPFLTADLNGCVDINPHIGVTATGVIDPATDTLYLTSKTYADQTQTNVAQGKPAGRYYVHAINVNDLSERPNFPVDLEGVVARNNPIRSFNGGIHHQRPALLHTGQYIYAGFASHCVQYNFTGWIMGWDKTTGAQVEDTLRKETVYQIPLLVAVFGCREGDWLLMTQGLCSLPLEMVMLLNSALSQSMAIIHQPLWRKLLFI